MKITITTSLMILLFLFPIALHARGDQCLEIKEDLSRKNCYEGLIVEVERNQNVLFSSGKIKEASSYSKEVISYAEEIYDKNSIELALMKERHAFLLTQAYNWRDALDLQKDVVHYNTTTYGVGSIKTINSIVLLYVGNLVFRDLVMGNLGG